MTSKKRKDAKGRAGTADDLAQVVFSLKEEPAVAVAAVVGFELEGVDLQVIQTIESDGSIRASEQEKMSHQTISIV